MPPSDRIVLFTRYPEAGRAKTRLIPALGADGAARLAQRLLEHAVAQALAAGLGPVELCVAPDERHPAFQPFAKDRRLALAAQGEGDLGARMARAFARVLAQPADGQVLPTLLIGTDAPGLDAARLRQAATELLRHDAVLGPAFDGGYTLIGLQRPQPRLFADMPWSTSVLMAKTRTRLATEGLRHAELAPLPDIDEAPDLVHLPPGWLPRR
jgi:rSAM/selenodomain-associated transferase 1